MYINNKNIISNYASDCCDAIRSTFLRRRFTQRVRQFTVLREMFTLIPLIPLKKCVFLF